MRQRFLAIAAVVAVVTIVTQSFYDLAASRSTRSVDQGFVAPQICPEAPTKATLTLAGIKAQALTTGKKPKVIAKTSGKERIIKVSGATYITGDDHAAAVATLSPRVAVASCRAAAIDSWFVGGSAALESQSTVTLINQAAGPATAEVTAWTPTGVAAPTTLTVPALSSVKVALDRYSAASVVIRVRVLSGRLGTYLLDQRFKGLTKLGADYVPAQPSPQKKVVILGVIGNSASRLRLLVPGTQDAVVRADLSIGSFRYTPTGLDDLRVKAGSVVELPLTTKNSSGFGALVLTSDVPIVAGVYTPLVQNKKQIDLLWLAPAQPLNANAMALYTPEASNSLLLFTEAASLTISATEISGKGKIAFSATPIGNLALKRSIRLPANSGAYVAQIVKSNSGMSIVPINPIELASKRVAPLNDLGVLAPR